MSPQMSAIMLRAKKFYEAAAARWGGYYGYFSDPDGYLWQVTTDAS
ncbi:hypothetical protein [Amycolatopsis sp. WAC 01376]|nr:hypothetical protein [Amycolatopsis sp. WAC 01376]